MGYNYNGRLKSAEILLQEDGSTRMIRRAETPEAYFATIEGFDFWFWLHIQEIHLGDESVICCWQI